MREHISYSGRTRSVPLRETEEERENSVMQGLPAGSHGG